MAKVSMMKVMGIAMAVMTEVNEALADGEVTVGEALELVTKAVEASGLSGTVLFTADEV